MQTQPQVTTDKNDYQYQPEFRHGLELLEQQKYQEAYALFVELAKQNPDNGYAQYELAILCQMNEQYGLALQSVTLAIQNLQNNSVWLAAAYVQRSRIYGALGNTEQQLQDLNKSILILPNAGNMYANRGDFYHTQKQYDLSEADYCKQAELEPGNAYPHAALGIIAIEKENYQEAEMHLSYALKLDPNYYQAYTLMGDCHLAGRNYVKAIECYTKSLAIRHGEERAEDALINRMPREGRTEECISRVNEGVSMAKSESETLQQAVMYLDAATLSAELKDYDIAHEYLRTSLSYSIAPYHSICGLSEYEILKQIPDFDKIVAEYL